MPPRPGASERRPASPSSPYARRPSARTDMTDEEKTIGPAEGDTDAPPSPSRTKTVDPYIDEDGNIIECREGWIAVLGCVLIALPCMGWGMVQGALQDYYASTLYTGTPEATLSFINGLIAFLCTFLAPLGGRLGDHFGYKPVMAVGLSLCTLSLCLSAFCHEVWQTFLAQGLLFGIGQGLVVPLILSLPSQWLGKNKGLGTGIVGGAAGLGGAIAALLARAMLSRLPAPHAFRNTMLIFMGMDAVAWATGWLLIRERIHRHGTWRTLFRPEVVLVVEAEVERGPGMEGREEGGARPVALEKAEEVHEDGKTGRVTVDASFKALARFSVFWLFVISVFVSTFAFLPPFQWITTYTKQFYTASNSLVYVVPLVSMNLALFIGRLLAGSVADRLGAVQTLLLYLEIGGFLQIVGWHFATNLAGICCFAIFYGFFGSCTISLIPVTVAQLFGRTDRLASLVGLAMQASSFGQLAGGFIAGKVLTAAGGNWLAFQLFTGFLQIVGGLLLLWPWYKVVGFRIGVKHVRA